ncbi:hypothetical protein [Psychroserpens mesophilus]|uniref:hypothetical protein n=1 Tax=Psychroserpens mesophilus TaxID=325473 RepID=UPI00058AE16E|nr:hypothetical protein [Psychroserpens mesophilus]
MNDNIKYYKDFDELTLTGFGLIKDKKKLNYPYVEVRYDEDNKVKDVFIHVSEKRVYVKDIVEIEGKRCLRYIAGHQDEGCLNHYYTLYVENLSYTFEYCGNLDNDENFYLSSLKISSKDKEVTYIYEPYKYKSKPTLDFINDIPKPKVTYNIHIDIDENNCLKYTEQRVDNWDNNSIGYEEVSCYELGNYSYFWWTYFGNRMKKVSCR